MAVELPLFDTLKNRADEGKLRFHMPGHKGKNVPESPLAGAMYLDFTELYGTGNLYDGLWPIADAEKLAAKAWSVPQAFFITGGASSGILASLLLARRLGEHILVDRGCHKSVYHGLALMGLKPSYIQPDFLEPFHIAKPIAPDVISKHLKKNPDISAVIITSPTYYGVISDITNIAKAVHEHGAILIVDEAHGAHLPFLDHYHSAAELGADLAICSMHKTLPALGQAAMVLASGHFSPEEIRRTNAVFGTSSPSYNIMASMDLARDYMTKEGHEISERHAERLRHLRERVNERGVFLALDFPGGDPLRLCIMTALAGLSGYQAAGILEDEFRIVCEMADERNVLFIITVADRLSDIDQLEDAIKGLENGRNSSCYNNTLSVSTPKIAMSLREAMISNCEQVPLLHAAGRVAAQNLCPYPPGIPVIAAGEVIDQSHLEHLCRNGFDPQEQVFVVKF